MKQADYRVSIFGGQSGKVVFFFTALHSSIWLYRGPIRRLVRHGFQVVAYEYGGGMVVRGQTQRFLDLNRALQADVRRRVRQARRHGADDFSCVGASMGTIFAIACTANIAGITRVVINTTYGSVAENVWTWRHLRRAKRAVQRQGMSLDDLERLLVPVSPIPNAPKLRGKRVLLYLSRRDRVLVYEQTRQFKDALDAAGVDYEYHENRRLGHIAGIMANFRRWPVWIGFLERQ